MSRFGWAFVNDVIIGTGSAAGTGSAVDGPAGAIVVKAGSIVSGATNFNFNNSTGFGQLTGSLAITSNLTVNGNLTSGPISTTTITATTNVSASSLTGTLRSNTGNKFGLSVGDVHQFTGSISAGVVSGTVAQFTNISGSIITGSTLLVNNGNINTITVSNLTSTTNKSTTLYVTGATNSIISGRNISTLGSYFASPVINAGSDPKADVGTTFYIKPDGSRIYIHDDTSNELLVTSLTTPWDITTLTVPFINLGTNTPTASGFANGLTFKPDGREAYILMNNRELYQATLNIPWDFSAATWTRKVTLSGSGGALGEQQGLVFSENGDYLFTCSGSIIIRYPVSSFWNASTINHTSYITASLGITGPVADFSLTNDGKSLLIFEARTGPVNTLYDFELGDSYNLGIVTQKNSIEINAAILGAGAPITGSMFLKPDQTKIYFYTLNTSPVEAKIISLSMTSSQVDLVGGIHITGDAKITQNINVYGDATFEDLSGSNAEFRILSGSNISGSLGNYLQLSASTARLTLLTGSTSVGGNIIPNVSNTYDLGSSGNRWKDIYVANSLNVPSISATAISGTSITGSITGSDAKFVSITGSLNGNASTATTLQNARNINGTSFNGSSAITTAQWGTARNITIGGTTRSVDGSTTYSWSLSDIGAAGTGSNNAFTGQNTFTTLSASSTLQVGGNTTLGTAATTTTINGQTQFNEIVNVAAGKTFTAAVVDINGGSIDGTIIGNASAVEGKFTVISGSTAVSSSQGRFTQLTASSALFTTIDTTNIEVTNIKALDGTSAASIANTTGHITINNLTGSSVDINGGRIDNTRIGVTIPESGEFTTVYANSYLQTAGPVTADGNIYSTAGDIWAAAGTSSRLRKGSPSSTYYGLGIKQDANTDGGRYGITLEAAGSTAHWDIYVNSGNDLRFVYANSTAFGGYLNNALDQGQIDFTGQHRNIPETPEIFNVANNVGLIVVSCGKYKNSNMQEKPSINESLPTIELSSQRNQKAVWGVVSDAEDPNESSREYGIGIFVTVIPKQNQEDNRVIINSIGEGAIWVCNINGNLENGDYVTTCEVPGYGMKQDDDLLHNYTVAKITQDCTFELNNPNYDCIEFQFSGSTYRKAFVGCTYHCG